MKESLYDENWTLLRRYGNQTEAAMVVGLLEGEGIPVYKLDGSIGVHLPGIGGSSVFVQACDLDRVTEILKELETSSTESDFSGEDDTAGKRGE